MKTLTHLQHEKLIISLIKDDLINYKLVHSLNDLGLNAYTYFLHLSESIFELMGFDESKRSDALFERYTKRLSAVKAINLAAQNNALEKLAKEIYNDLLTKCAIIRDKVN